MTVGLMTWETVMKSHSERNMPEDQQRLILGPSLAEALGSLGRLVDIHGEARHF